MAGSGDEIAAGAGGRGHLRASHADRERVIGTLKAAFAQGMLDRDEFGQRVSQTFAARTYADLSAVTADLPAGLAGDRLPRQPARAQVRPPMSNAAKASICVVIAVAVPVILSIPTGGAALFAVAPFYLMALLVAAAQILASRHHKRSGGQLPRRPTPGAGGQASRRLPPAGPGGQLPPVNPGHRHAAEAAQSRRPRQWRPCLEAALRAS
jgi:hypothetical protein